ncbi:NrfD/PsrC family molybdoenzyme membrane anchor subunit [Mariniflexile sp.]|uniref:NrfD/PsrC family molybdoenzyme membrane anchor subunit n=1 Tax=Mariniflexile sp. TaxID=1979402 RepID=UPI00404723B8
MKSFENLTNDLAPKKFGLYGKLWVGFLLIVIFAGVYGYYQQFTKGLVITGMRDYVLWGIYISNFVFFVAISLVGSLITAILRLSGVTWATPLTRIAEIIAVAAIIMGGLTIIIDMGRPDRIYNLFLHGRLQSPIVWDVIVVTTYLTISLLLLFFPLLPDFKILSDKFQSNKKLSNIYKKLSLNWNGNFHQRRIYNWSIKTLSVLIIPVAFGIHTVTSWLFAATYRPGWDSSNFGPYFIAGAFVAGAAAVIAVMYVLRRTHNLQEYITDFHFDIMGKLLVLLILVYLYFNVNEYLVPALKMTKGESEHLNALFTGEESYLFWTVILGGLVIPTILLLFKKMRKPLPMFIIGIAVVVGAWWKRYIIVVPTLLHPFLPIQGVPKSWHSYSPTPLEWLITWGTLAGALLIVTLLVRYVPVIPIHEIAEERGIVEPKEIITDEK